MTGKLKTYAIGIRIIAVLILAGVFGVVFYQLYDFYSERLGFTADRAIETYITAWATSDFETIYAMTPKENLTDIYGRPITKGEFFDELAAVIGKEGLPLRVVEVEKILDRDGTRYYRVTLTSELADATGTSHIRLALTRDDRTWLVEYPFAIVL